MTVCRLAADLGSGIWLSDSSRVAKRAFSILDVLSFQKLRHIRRDELMLIIAIRLEWRREAGNNRHKLELLWLLVWFKFRLSPSGFQKKRHKSDRAQCNDS